jgi:hypothetical protein
VFFYAHSVTDADREHILGLEKSYFQLRQNFAKKQKTMYDFFVKKGGLPDLPFPRIHHLFSPLPWKMVDRENTVLTPSSNV